MPQSRIYFGSAASESNVGFSQQDIAIPGEILTDTSFALGNTPIANSLVAWISTGPMLDPGTDFTITGNQITLLASSPTVQQLTLGDSVVVSYAYLLS